MSWDVRTSALEHYVSTETGEVTVKTPRNTRAMMQMDFQATVPGFGFMPQYPLHSLVF
jgi:hypothetical protein